MIHSGQDQERSDYTLSDGSAWHESTGDDYDCDYYNEDDRCDDYGDDYEYGGYTANEACCTCGGGSTGTDDELVQELSAINHQTRSLSAPALVEGLDETTIVQE